MSERETELAIEGLTGAPGIAFGRILHLASAEPQAAAVAMRGVTARATLQAAVDRARRELAALIGRSDGLAASIFEFQAALLEDGDLLEPIYVAAVEAGPAPAWTRALDGEIAAYRGSGDEALAGRAADLEDLKLRVLEALAGRTEERPRADIDGAILVADEFTPSRFFAIDWSRARGAASARGSASAHVAMLARARGVPLVVGLGPQLTRVPDGELALLDADRGALYARPSPVRLRDVETRRHAGEPDAAEIAQLRTAPAATAAGEPVQIMVNVDDPRALAAIQPEWCDGVGLTRTELLFDGRLAGEEEQYEAYVAVLDWAAGKPVIIRTLDAGGDKPILGFTPIGEANPFLGLRGLRLSLARPEVFRVQLAALARAAGRGPLKVMVPMVTRPDEFEAFRALFAEVITDLGRRGVAARLPDLGMMVETPAAALRAAEFKVDFYSIGSNDLIQYALAVARGETSVAALYDPRDPAVRELIARVVEAGRATDREVSLCGDMASDPQLVPLLLDAGLRKLSVAPSAIGTVKRAVSSYGR
jgi:phosphotransferase system enzyme I (PtsI)